MKTSYTLEKARNPVPLIAEFQYSDEAVILCALIWVEQATNEHCFVQMTYFSEKMSSQVSQTK